MYAIIVNGISVIALAARDEAAQIIFHPLSGQICTYSPFCQARASARLPLVGATPPAALIYALRNCFINFNAFVYEGCNLCGNALRATRKFVEYLGIIL
jgi:hypothetical protein